MERTMRKLYTMLAALIIGAGAFAATYGPWGESDAVRNPDKLGPTYLMNMPLTINGTAAVQGDCVAVYRQDTSALCGLGKVLDGTGKLTLVCYAPQGTTLRFKVWVAVSGTTTPTILDCQASCDLSAPAPGAFYTGHSLTTAEEEPVETKVATPVVSPVDGTTFADSCTITITCATDDASIYYTTNGNTPKLSSKYLYSAPITVYDSVKVKAIAKKDGLENSDTILVNITKLDMTLESAIGATAEMTVTTGGDKNWEPVKDSTAKSGVLSAKSGLKGDDDDENESWLQVAVNGPGMLTYWAKASCEHDYEGTCTWDHLEVYADNVEQTALRMDGETDWTQKTIEFTKTGAHTVKWRYTKDDCDYEGEDCAWINGVVWTSSAVPVDPIPDIGDTPSSDDVKTALEGSVDTKLATHITAGDDYNAYRAWAQVVKKSDGSAVAGQQAVKDSPNAWLAFALHTDKLIDVVPKDGDLKFYDFAPASETGKFDMTVELMGVEVGTAATAKNLKQVFVLEGSSTLDADSFSPSNVAIEFGTPVGGKVKCTAVPVDKTAGSFFLKMKLK